MEDREALRARLREKMRLKRGGSSQNAGAAAAAERMVLSIEDPQLFGVAQAALQRPHEAAKLLRTLPTAPAVADDDEEAPPPAPDTGPARRTSEKK